MRFTPIRGLLIGLISFVSVLSLPSQATTVQFQTVLGDFEVNLYDETTPLTVANFLDYVNSGAYENTLMHRLASGFVLQGGGFTYTDSFPPSAIAANAPVQNEPVYANVRGTIAMAKQANNPNSATTQWFINLSDNSANLDAQNGGFTVFGEVMGDGMSVVNAIAALRTENAQSPFGSLPVRDYTEDDSTNNVPLTDEHLVLITNIVVLDAATDTANGLNPTLNTNSNSSSSGGSINNLYLTILLALTFAAQRPKKSPRIKLG